MARHLVDLVHVREPHQNANAVVDADPAPTRVVVADDWWESRLLTRTTLEATGQFTVIGEAADGLAAASMITELAPDLALIDVAMPGLNGLQVISACREKSPRTAIVMLSGLSDAAEMAIELGASGYLSKEIVGDELVTRLNQIVSGTAPAASAASAEAPPRDRERLLVISSDPARAQLFAADAAFEVRTVPTVAEAVHLLLSERAAVVVIDTDRPDSRGVMDVTELLTADGDVALLVLSAAGAPDDAVDAVQLGAQDFLVTGDLDPAAAASAVRGAIARKQVEIQLRQRALYDGLTGLPNRTLLLDRLQQSLARLARRDSTVAVLFVDLDGFKPVNDQLGHAAGDRLLIEISQRIASVLRTHDTAARYGGDEFVLVCDSVRRPEDAAEIASRVQNLLRRPMEIDGHDVRINCSVGIATTSSPTADPQQLIRDADAAMYRAKRAGKARLEVFDTAIRRRTAVILEKRRALERAAQNGEFVVHYQPIVRVDDSTVVGAEALVRWRAGSGDPLPPSEFLELAEQSGAVVEMGAVVLDDALRVASAWVRDHEIASDLPLISVNLSARQLREPYVTERLRHALVDAYVDPSRLCIELTEDVFSSDAVAARRALTELKAAGVRIGLDDFGSGSSTLSTLRQFPFDIVKLDRSAVAVLEEDPVTRALDRAVIDLGGELGMTVVAEGVETRSQRDLLRDLGCPLAQGHLFSAAVAADEVELLLGRSLAAA